MKHLNLKNCGLTIFAIFTISYIALVYIGGQNISDVWTALKVAYKTIPVVLFIIGIFVTYLWRWKIFQGWLVPFPNLNGTWQGEIRTTWQDPATRKVPAPIPVILSIKQSFIRISCVMRTAEMTSRSFLADFWLDGNEQIKMLGYSYHCKPLPSVQDKSKTHEGTVIFEILGVPVNKLKGTYWTARKTTGEIILTFREKRCLDEMPGDLGERRASTKR